MNWGDKIGFNPFKVRSKRRKYNFYTWVFTVDVSIPSRYDPNWDGTQWILLNNNSFNPFKVRSKHDQITTKRGDEHGKMFQSLQGTIQTSGNGVTMRRY